MKVLSPINENTDIVDKKYVDDAVSGVQTQVSAKKYWADIEVSGSSSKTSAPTFSPDFKFNVASNSVIGAAANKAIASPLAKYLWHDIISFGVNGDPTVTTSANGGSTWSESNDVNLQKKLFIQREDQSVTVLDDTKTAIRWQWYSTQFHACQASYLNIGFAYSAKQATFNILWETSTDGSTWTTSFKADGVKYTSSPYWFYLTTNWSNAYWARLTLTRTSGAGTTANISGIKLLTPRWGNQGRGGEYEKPYSWDYLQNIFPRANNSATLGTSTAKWKNVYATTFTGDLTGTANKATNDSDGNKISTTYVKAGALGDYYLKTEVNQALADLKSEILGEGIDEAYDTLLELSELISANQGSLSALSTLINGKLDKTTYEFNKELNLGGSGKVCIGKFPMYDSNITVTINSTTNTTYHGVLVIATQNINTSLGGTYKAVVYGDASNTLTSSIKIQYLNGSNVFAVYIDLPGWSKNLMHIQCSALKAAPTDIATMVDAIPSTATIVPTNALTTNFASKAVATTTTDGLMSASDRAKLDYFLHDDGLVIQPYYISSNILKTEDGIGYFRTGAQGGADYHGPYFEFGGEGIPLYFRGRSHEFVIYNPEETSHPIGLSIHNDASVSIPKKLAIGKGGTPSHTLHVVGDGYFTGTVTATAFIGPFSGDVEGNAATASYATSAGKAAELVTAKKIELTSQDSSNAQIAFSRTGYNYITFPSNGYLAFATSASGAGIVASVSSTAFLPYTTNKFSIGTSSKVWSAVYATTFNGNATSATKATQDGDGNVITTTYAKIADVSGLDIFAGMTLKTGVKAKTHSGWDNVAKQDKIIPTMNFIAYWNGAYDSSNVSNLTYCVKGAFGDAAIKAVTTSVTSGSASLVTSGGVYTALASYLPLTGGTLAGTSQNTPLTIKGTTSGNDAWIAFHNNSGFLASLGVSADKKLKIYANSTSYNVWTAANQGSGSGLDADKLDGNEASAFALANGTNASGTWRISISGNATTATTSSRLTALAPSNAGHTLYFYSGQPKIGTATGSAKEGSNAYDFYSYPSADATATNGGASANIISLRMQWGTTYLHEIFASPNQRALWHRWITNNSPQPWSRIVLENNSSETETYNITVADSDKLGGQSASYYAAASSLESFLTLDGARTMTGAIKVAETKGILLRHANTTYTAGIGYDTQGNECIAMWAKNAVTRLRWHAGTDMSGTTYQQMMSITPDFEISKADGTAKGYIGGSAIVTAANISSYIPSGGGSTADLSNYVVKNGTGVQCIGGGLVVGATSASGVSAAAAGRIMITGHTNPLIGLLATGSSTPFYFQVSSDIVYLGPTSSVALSLDGSGNTTVRGTFTSIGSITGSLVNGITVFGKKYNNASEITVADTDIVTSVTEGTSTCTDGTEFLTSWASDNGFNDTSGKNKLYRRKMSKVYDYIKGKLDSVYLGKTANAVNGTFYGVCDTAEATVAKTVTISGFPSTLTAGIQVTIKFTNKSGVASATLNVNGTGAKPIYRYGRTAVSTGTTTSGWVAGAVQTFTYDGTGWVREYWNNTTYSNVALGQGYATCSTAAATTAKTAALSSYALTANGIVSIKFTYDVPASATLNINSKGAKAMYYKGAAIKAGVIKAGDTATFIYNTYYHLISIDRVADLRVSISNETATSKSISPNVYYKWGTMSSLSITLATPSDSTVLNNYMFEFTASSAGCSLTMPSGIKWQNGSAPTIEASKTYQISIINNLAVASMFS